MPEELDTNIIRTKHNILYLLPVLVTHNIIYNTIFYL